jgi:hypothetical protein
MPEKHDINCMQWISVTLLVVCVSWSSFDNIGCGAFPQGDQSGIMTLFGAEYEESSSSSSSESSSPPRPVFVHEAARRKQTPQVCDARTGFFFY